MKIDVHMNLQFKEVMNKCLQRTFASALITVSSQFYSTGCYKNRSYLKTIKLINETLTEKYTK